jgi:3-hydroxyacyl-[acyl-carrier-protein] dehydratase
MRYLLIDRITRIVYNKELTAIKCVTVAEDYFFEHFAGYPVMPGALQIESAAQAATALLEVSNDFTKKAFLLMVEKIKFRRIVHPGEMLMVNVKIKSLKSDSALIEAEITSGGKRVMGGEMIFGLGDIDKFYPIKTRHLIDAFYDYWLKDAEIIK